MKRFALAFILSVSLAACGQSAPDTSTDAAVNPAPDAYADLADGTLLVRVEANPNIGADQCNPVFNYALRTDAEAVRLNVTYLVQDQDIMGTGFSIVRDANGSVATGSAELSSFDPVDAACSDVTVKLHDLTCTNGDTDDAMPCPDVVFEGTEIFASFTP